MNNVSPFRSPALLWVAWVLVIVELLSPIPAFLTLGAAYVLLFRPAWFPEIVNRLYDDGPGAAAD